MTTPPDSTGLTASARSGHWQRRLAELAGQHRVPGASLGIQRVPADGSPDELDLDAPVADALPGLALAEADTARRPGRPSAPQPPGRWRGCCRTRSKSMR